MRYTAILAVLAASVAAYPQDQPISQISDGQIQAPPATETAPVAPSGSGTPVPLPTPVVPPTVPSVVPSGGASSGVAPSVVPSVTAPVPVPAPSGPSAGTSLPAVSSGGATFPNSTVAVSSPAGSTGAGSSPTESAPPANTGAATANMVSFGGLVLAIAGAVFA